VGLGDVRRVEVSVHHVEPDRRIGFSWNSYDPTAPTTVDIRLDPRPGGATYVQVTETGFSGDGDTVVQQVAASTEGFTFVLCALKAWLEHELVLRVVEDAHPDQRVA
jgi:uncharacterized protein YndB with AHSA1/START domain